MLPDSRLHLLDICKDGGIRAWLEGTIKHGLPVYMMVGIHTVKDAKIVHKYEASFGAKASAQVPTDAIVPTGAADLPSGATDIGASAEKWNEATGSSRFIAPGEQIIAIQYRKLKFKWSFSRDLDSVYLEQGNRWKIYMSGRSDDDNNEEVEVEFEENATIDGDGDHARFADSRELFLVK
jgi:hypothetical protein